MAQRRHVPGGDLRSCNARGPTGSGLAPCAVRSGWMIAPSLIRRREIIAALRNGTVPRRGLELFAVGLGRFDAAIEEELGRAALGEGVFKAVRGEYGTGKTFFSRWVQHRAQEK